MKKETKPIIITLAGCSGTGKTTLVEKIKAKQKIVHISFKNTFKDNIKKIIEIPKFLLFNLKNLYILKEIYKNTQKQNLLLVIREIMTSYYVLTKEIELAKKQNINIIIRDEPLYKIIITRQNQNYINNTEELINILNKKIYNKYPQHIIINKLPVEEILKRRKKRNKKRDQKQKTKIINETKNYNKKLKELIPKIKHDSVHIITNTNEKKIIKIIDEKNKLS